MTDQPTQSFEVLDAFDLTSVDANRPLIKDGPIKVTIAEMRIEPGKKDPNSKLLVVVFKTAEPTTATNGKALDVGFKHTERVSLAQTEKYDPRERLAQMQLCFIGAQGKWNTNDMLNREGVVKMGTETSDEFGAQNRIRGYIKKKVDAPTLLCVGQQDASYRK